MPFDGLVANAVYTPAGDVRGSFDRPRTVQLRVGRLDSEEGHVLADASPQGDDFFLPANESQNIPFVGLVGLRVREGDTLYWYSHVLSDRPGVPDPGGTVEAVFEPRTVSDVPYAQCSDFREFVPDYWRGRSLYVLFLEREVPSLPPGGGGIETRDYTGTFKEATAEGIEMTTSWILNRFYRHT